MKIFPLLLNLIALPVVLCADETWIGRMHLAGMPPEIQVPVNAELAIHPETSEDGQDHLAIAWGDVHLGYIPAIYRAQIESLIREGDTVLLRVNAQSSHPRPGQFLQVDVWTTGRNPGESRILRPPEIVFHQDDDPEWE
ncbi:MAG: hypothetical protein JJU29_17685 [Verrucomicrobia bacterium]|nr:hypothetical protein [Verrucomicrobiota bacterium]